MIENIKKMKTNYKKLDDIIIEIRNSEIEELLKFDSNGRYKFFKCETCGGPILGHQEVKCRCLDGIRYNKQIVKSFEDWLERIAVLRQAVTERERKMKAITANEMGETIKVIIESIETRNPRNPNNPTTQLVKSRWPPLWSGQKFDKWKHEIEKWSENNK